VIATAVCAVLDLSEANQRVLLRRARGRLRQVLETEGALAPDTRRGFEKHLAGCPHCTEYLAQIEATIRMAGQVALADLPPQMRTELTALYQRGRDDGADSAGDA
jgi:Putative zinc-finger